MTESLQNRLAIGFIVLLIAGLGLYLFSETFDDGAEIDKAAHEDMIPVAPGARVPQRSPGTTHSQSDSLESSAPISLVAVPPGEELHVPDYGPFLKRGRCRAEFAFVDGRGQPLRFDRPAGFSLFRKYKGQWHKLQHATSYDSNTATLRVEGRAGAGLEPGNYEVDADCSPYGAKRIAFQVGHGQVYRETVRFSVWRHVLAIRFQDESGRLLDRINLRPQCQTRRSTLPKRQSATRPGKLLMDSPGTFLFGGRHSFTTREYRSYASGAYLLDNGTWHLPVYVGAVNTIEIPFSTKDHGARPFTMATTFEDSVEVPELFTLKLSTELQARMSLMKVRNESNIGNTRALFPPPEAVPAEPLKKTKVLGKEEFNLLLTRLSPTVREFALGFELRWSNHGHWQGTTMGDRSEKELGGPTLTIPDLKQSRFHTFSEFEVDLGGAEDHRESHVSFKYKMSGMEKFYADTFRLPCPGPSLAMRLVDPTGRPVPWGEASLVDLEQDDIARGLRQKFIDGGIDPSKLEVEYVFGDDNAQRQDSSRRSDTKNNITGYSITPPDFIEDEKARERFSRFGTWYNSRRGMRGDIDGYMFLNKASLRPGNIMVLYIWGTSRDQNRPDKRIVFRVTRGTTDLGAIVVNDHN